MGQQASGGQGGEVAAGEFNLGGAELCAEFLHTRFAGGEMFMQAVLPLNGGEVGDGVLVLAAPGDERGLGDVEFGGDAGEHPALNAEVNETLDGFLVVHTVLSGRNAGLEHRPRPLDESGRSMVTDVGQTRSHVPDFTPHPTGKGPKKTLEAATGPDRRAPPADPVNTAHGEPCFCRSTATAPRWN